MYTSPGTHLVHEYASLGKPFVFQTPTTPLSQAPVLLQFNHSLAKHLGLNAPELCNSDGLNVLTGGSPWPDYPAVASIYCGHQFGVFVPQLGDGRALMVAELRSGQAYAQLQLKGAGPTPFSRMGDGRAVLRSSIREYVASEALHALGIPTTRALSLTSTADPVFRETTETAAVVCRVSESFLRFGHVEYFSSTQQHEALAELLDWHIDRHHSDLGDVEDDPNVRFDWLKWVISKTATLMAQWQAVGFCHGVMNTDNMSLLAQTIDYGPYGFMDDFNIDHICNHSDHQGRYSYRNQPRIGHWNLHVLTQALLPVLGQSVEDLQSALDEFPALFQAEHNRLFMAKLGISGLGQEQAQPFIENTLKFMHEQQVDFTRFFRSLKALNPEQSAQENFVHWQRDPFFAVHLGQSEGTPQATQNWLEEWLQCVDPSSFDVAALEQTNPALVPRNHLLQKAIEQCEQGNPAELNKLISALSDPYNERETDAEFYAEPPAWAKSLELSCSS